MTEEIVTEDRPLNVIEDEDEENEVFNPEYWEVRQRNRLKQKNQAHIDEFIASKSRIFTTGKLPTYYGELLTWALYQYLQRRSWKIVATFGYREPEPVYKDINTSKETRDLLLIDGQLLIKMDNDRYALTVDIAKRSSIQIEGPENKKEEMTKFIVGVLDIAKKENFYRGKNVEFNGEIRFLDIKEKSWDNVVLDFKIKTEIKANTIDFLRQSERWIQYGIPLKRGVLLAGEPGTGKTIVCKALMSEAKGITCITTNAYVLNEDEYITLLYELAEDLNPCIVFIEDIDSIGQNRMEFGYQKGPALLSLLSVLDGIEEKKNIVTVATTNCLEILDKAISQRPSRFDRIIKLSVPSVEQRRELIRHICKQIPLDEELQEYIATQADNCTPAYVQEIIYCLAILQPAEQNRLQFSHEEIDYVISSITNKNKYRIGFYPNGTSNERKQNHTGPSRSE